MKIFYYIISLAFVMSQQIAAQAPATPIDVRLNSINATAKEAFAIKSDIGARRAKSGQETTSVISDLNDQLRARRDRINKDVEDLKKILFEGL